MTVNRTILWAIAWLVILGLVATGWVQGPDRVIAGALRVVGTRVPAANLIWVLGGIPLTGLVVLGAVVRDRRLSWLLWMVVGLMVEAVTKHFLATPFPLSTPEPVFFSRLESATNLTPSDALRWMHGLFHVTASTGPHKALFRGTFPSGHVFRITYATGSWLRNRQWTWPIALVAGFLVVATGGHWAIDAVGGFLLARAMLALAGSVNRAR